MRLPSACRVAAAIACTFCQRPKVWPIAIWIGPAWRSIAAWSSASSAPLRNTSGPTDASPATAGKTPTYSSQPMNYRHAYHAGNFADVFKHAALIELMASCKAKPKLYCYLDTHAGRGAYALDGEQARKTGEAADGVLRLLAAPDVPAPLRAYVDLVRSMARQHDASGGVRYPGSPLVADALLRDQDRAVERKSRVLG